MDLAERLGDRVRGAASATDGSVSILVVDDDENDWLHTRRLFRGPILSTYTLDWARDRDAALYALLGDEYAVALIDLRLGHEDGLALVREAIAAGCRTPLIVLAAHDDPAVDRAAAAAGAADYLVKGQLDGRTLERALRYARVHQTARDALVRAQRGIAAIEEVGRVLASDGPTPAALQLVMDVLVERVGYQLPSIYLGDREVVRLGAQRGYEAPYPTIAAGSGVIGRVMRTGDIAFLPSTAGDPDYLSAETAANAEICAPLVVDGEFLGILNIESTAERRLDRTDLKLVASIADRLAIAIALGRERRAIAARAEMLARLNDFVATVAATLQAGDLHQRIVDKVASVVDCDIVVLAVRDRDSGAYAIAAMRNGDPAALGLAIIPGEGLLGRVIAERVLMAEPRLDVVAFSAAYRAVDSRGPDAPREFAVLAVPLLHADDCLGALSIWRADPDRAFVDLDREGLTLAAGQVGMALANADLHAAVAEMAIRDGLTGLHNRRYFDEAYHLLIAGRARTVASETRPFAAIMFDLDEFGQLNKVHGHQTGDEILRIFGRVLRRRFRASDLVARYGGEEFIVVLDGATGEAAERLADEVREELLTQTVTAPNGTSLAASVSAGCATLTDTDATGEALLAMADIGLNLAKRGGRNRVVRV
jgi:diguanylate cyclase (GGDEF)-like protein